MGGEPFCLPSVRSHLSQQRNCSHATQGRWKFVQIFLFSFSIRSPMCFKDIVIDIDRFVIIIITIIIIIIIYCYYYYYYDIFIRSYFPGYLFLLD